MQTTHTTPAASRGAQIAGWIASGLAIAFLVFDTVVKVIQSPMAVEPTVGLGYRAERVLVIGLIELVCLALYAFPRTAVLGAVLLTGYLGGAVAINLRAETPMFNIVFPFLIGAFVWAGVLLREQRLRALVPFRGDR
jgi:hypothetical protein